MSVATSTVTTTDLNSELSKYGACVGPWTEVDDIFLCSQFKAL